MPRNETPVALRGGGTRSSVYLIVAVNACQALAVNVSVLPSRLVVSRTVITPLWLASSTQSPPLPSE